MYQGASVPRLDCAKLYAAQISKIGRKSPRAQETQRFEPISANGAQKTEREKPSTEIRAQRIERGKPQPFALSLSKRKRSIGRSLCSALSANHRLLTPNSSSWLAKGHRFSSFHGFTYRKADAYRALPVFPGYSWWLAAANSV